MLVLGSQVFKKGGWQPGFGSREGARAGSLFPLSGFWFLSRSVPRGSRLRARGKRQPHAGRKRRAVDWLGSKKKKNKPIRELRRASKQGYRLGWIGD